MVRLCQGLSKSDLAALPNSTYFKDVYTVVCRTLKTANPASCSTDGGIRGLVGGAAKEKATTFQQPNR